MLEHTPEWHEWRSHGIGGSEAPVIMGVSEYSTPMYLWEKRVGLREPSEGSSYVKDLGRYYEPKARAAYELKTGLEFPSSCVEHAEHSFLHASLDGLNIEEKKILEIKWGGKKLIKAVSQGIVPNKFYPQCQHNLMVCGEDFECHFVAWSKEEEKTYSIIVKPDIDYCQRLFEKELMFWLQIQHKIRPELVDADYKTIRKMPHVGDLFEKWDDLNSRIGRLKDAIKKIEKEVREELPEARMRWREFRIDENGISKKGKG